MADSLLAQGFKGGTLLTYYAHYTGENPPTWQARCTCGWRGERRPDDHEQQAKDLATCHAIETGHDPVWEPKR